MGTVRISDKEDQSPICTFKLVRSLLMLRFTVSSLTSNSIDFSVVQLWPASQAWMNWICFKDES